MHPGQNAGAYQFKHLMATHIRLLRNPTDRKAMQKFAVSASIDLSWIENTFFCNFYVLIY